MAGSPGSSMSLRRGSTWALAGGGACVCVAVAVADPEQRQLTPSCPFRVATGWWCPFCGATRSVSRLVRGDVAAAARYNLLLVSGLVAVGLALVVGRTRIAAGIRGWAGRRSGAVLLAATVLVVGFTVLRNVPGLDTYLRYPGA